MKIWLVYFYGDDIPDAIVISLSINQKTNTKCGSGRKAKLFLMKIEIVRKQTLCFFHNAEFEREYFIFKTVDKETPASSSILNHYNQSSAILKHNQNPLIQPSSDRKSKSSLYLSTTVNGIQVYEILMYFTAFSHTVVCLCVLNYFKYERIVVVIIIYGVMPCLN